jgi:hypothetical protein
MMVIFAGRGELIVRFAFILLLSLSIFLSLVLYISGMRSSSSPCSSAFTGRSTTASRPPPMGSADGRRTRRATTDAGARGDTRAHAVIRWRHPRSMHLGDCGAPGVRVREESHAAPTTAPSACLSVLQRGEGVKQLPACAHLFHDWCIDAWLRMGSHVTCPVCRCPVDAAALPEDVVVLTQ